jgi:hypothetical protein
MIKKKGVFMRKFAQVMVALVLCLLASTIVLTNEAEAQAHHDKDNGKTQQYGPFASTSPDSGTCGNNWANDTFKRSFTIDKSHPNVVLEKFEDGRFVTIAGQSPNACVILAGPRGNGNTVGAGVTGKFSGSFDVAVSRGTFNPRAKCTPATCNTTAGFIRTVYGSNATFSTGATFFEFDYHTRKNGAWHNASANRGGNRGDITGSSDPHTSISRRSSASLK